MQPKQESAIEAKLVKEMSRRGCLCYKWVSPGHTGVPDRLIITPDGEVIPVELKTETGRLSAIQRAQLRRLRTHGLEPRVLYGAKDVERFIADYDAERR